MSLKAALATDNQKQFMDRHFGDAKYYMIFKIDKHGAELINEIVNTSGEERRHADPQKAKSIIDLLKDEEVMAGVSKKFGPNIMRIKKHLVPIIINEQNIEDGILCLIDNYDKIMAVYEKGADRNHIVLK